MLVQTINLVHAPTMVLLIFNNQLFDDCITGLPTDELRASHYTHQNQTRMGLHEEIPCLQQQEIGVTAVQTYQDTGAVLADTGVPPYLKRKLLMRHDGMICSTFNVIRKLTSKQQQTEQAGPVATAIARRRKGKWLHSVIAILVRYPTTVTGFIRTVAITISMKMRRSGRLALE